MVVAAGLVTIFCFKMNSKEIIKQVVALDKGIIPFCVWYNPKGGINQARWESLDIKSKRQSKRKFRKLFRKACRKFDIDYGSIKGAPEKAYLVRKYILEFCEESVL